MLKRGTIQNITDYFFEEKVNKAEVDRAFLEFIGAKDMSELQMTGINEEAVPLFNEWFVYDFKLKSGKCPMKEYAEVRRSSLSDEEKEVYRNLLDTNFYSMFEVVSVWVGQGMDMLDLRSGKIYNVSEKAASFTLRKGNIVSGRLAKAEDVWEMVGSDPAAWDLEIMPGMRETLLKMKGGFGPKELYQIMYISDAPKTEGFTGDEPSFIDEKKARRRLEQILEAQGLTGFVSLETIQKWIYENESRDAFSEILSLLVGLLNCDITIAQLNALSETLLDFYHVSPQKFLRGKTPEQASFQRDLAGEPPRILLNTWKIGGEKWLNAVERAHEYLQAHQYKKGAEYFEKAFKNLLEEKTTRPDIYRALANAALCQFGTGEKERGKRLLDMALELNPNYDFAQMVMAGYEKGDYNNVVLGGALTQMVGFKTTQKDVGIRHAENYFTYIKGLGINFATSELTRSTITKMDGKGVIGRVGRNDPCPCGSGKKYKKCHGK